MRLLLTVAGCYLETNDLLVIKIVSCVPMLVITRQWTKLNTDGVMLTGRLCSCKIRLMAPICNNMYLLLPLHLIPTFMWGRYTMTYASM